MKKCIHVGILDFTLFEHERYYSCFHIWEDTIRDMYSDKFEIHVLELPKLAKYEYPQTELLRWAQFFGARSREEIEVLAEKDEYIHKAYDKLEEISADEEKRLEYEERQKAIRDHRHMLASGRREGLREGLREGKHEHAVEMARKMLEDKLPIRKERGVFRIITGRCAQVGRTMNTKQNLILAQYRYSFTISGN